MHLIFFLTLLTCPCAMLFAQNQSVSAKTRQATLPSFQLIPAQKFVFRSFVDCNMASVWIGDSFRIFPGKYGEDPLWGDSRELKYTSGTSVDAVFNKNPGDFIEPKMPANSLPGLRGLHGAVWFETLYQDPGDQTGNTLYALYHNENYPSTLPYDSITGEGYIDKDWPEGLRGPETKTAVCRIGIMKSTDGGKSWKDRGIILEDLQPRLILRPYNTGINFAGGVGDPSAVANGGFLYIFYGEYGYPGSYDSSSYDPAKESKGQCISIARVPLKDLDNPAGLARRWNGSAFNASGKGIGYPIASLQIPADKGGGPASSLHSKYYWGPSVSWNEYLHCWIMLMALAEGPSWNGNSIYISYNRNPDLSTLNHAQEWSKPKLLLKKPGHILWYPSLQPLNTPSDKKAGFTSVRLGKRARLFYKDTTPGKGDYLSEYLVSFE